MRRCFSRGARSIAPLSLWASTRLVGTNSELPEPRPLHKNDNFLSGTSAMYLDSLYHQWRQDPNSVDSSWQQAFGNHYATEYEQPLLNSPLVVAPVPVPPPSVASSKVAGDLSVPLSTCFKAMQMIYAFEEFGHLNSDLDPLEFRKLVPTEERMPTRLYGKKDLSLESFGFTADDAGKPIAVYFSDRPGGIRSEPHCMTIGDLHKHLTSCYCGKVGIEVSHVTDPEIKRFIRSQVENLKDKTVLRRPFTSGEKKVLLEKVARACYFEDFFKRKFTTAKRFGSDGAETLVVGMSQLMNAVAKHGVEKVNVCMAHRGRLNVLTNVVGKPFDVLLKEFQGINKADIEPFKIQSDVKYHLGSQGQFIGSSGHRVEMEVLSNPSHLEAVNPVLQGYTKANQRDLSPTDGVNRCIPIEIHGDASFMGQGVVFESMTLSEVGEFGTGGTIHVICNNQIGFTTDPKQSRSSAHCTALGKTFGCPIIHVNGDSPEDVARVFEFAAEFRLAFQKSIIIDLVAYRRFGHNENDDPSITNPVIYEHIKKFPDVFQRYGEQLVKEGIVTKEEVDQEGKLARDHYNGMQKNAAPVKYSDFMRSSISKKWKGMKYSDELGKVTLRPTAITPEVTEKVLNAMSTYPPGFQPHKKLLSVLDRRNDTIRTGEGIEWGTAEALAFGSLLLEGKEVRVSGQDVQRGTFAQRHAVLRDVNTDATYAPLSALESKPQAFSVLNSPLSEFGTLAYAAGYSVYSPDALTLWEAQYGDFANGATIVFDQFLSAGEDKWNQQQAVVVTLPHGYDGKGPEHSSGRLERFLQMSSEDVTTPALSKEMRLHSVNWEIVYPTTPAQYFHLLRRHMCRDFRKALVIFFSKQFLRAPNVSSIKEFQGNSEFLSVIDDDSVNPSACTRVVFCTGQVYFYLQKHRETKKISDVAIVRVEELSPFPRKEIEEILQKYPKAELVWAQEEPKNMGAWGHFEPRIEEYTKGTRPVRFAGRATSSSPSTGYSKRHDAEQLYVCQVALEKL